MIPTSRDTEFAGPAVGGTVRPACTTDGIRTAPGGDPARAVRSGVARPLATPVDALDLTWTG
ncbi:hypothetical protein HCB17_18080 [Salinispora arenicola]|uniref:hypothetical protein n=1 Tax=Salinispora arenicola TaxID=168697 RepID=UPI0014316B25|nr:hypothetical protein [Salinispora arenicola]NIL42846.1 hypothetical protein [Salinispora arenicola]